MGMESDGNGSTRCCLTGLQAAIAPLESRLNMLSSEIEKVSGSLAALTTAMQQNFEQFRSLYSAVLPRQQVPPECGSSDSQSEAAKTSAIGKNQSLLSAQ